MLWNPMKDFKALYRETINELNLVLKEFDLSVFSRHNRGYQAYQTTQNMTEAFYEERPRYEKSFDFILSLQKEQKAHRILDVGCLFGILPIILRKALIDIEIHVIDNYSFYKGSLNSVERLLRSYDIEVHDVDILEGIPFPEDHFNLVTLLAVIEHLAFSPLRLFIEIKRILEDNGYFIIDTPNVGSLGNRINFLFRGIPPYARLEDFLFSEVPFTGHCREYSRKDIAKILECSGFEIKLLTQFNIGTFKNMGLRSLILHRFLPWVFPGLRNYIWCTAQPERKKLYL